MVDAIARVGLTHLQIPYKEPCRIQAAGAPAKDAILIAVETAAGRVGLGECSPPDGGGDPIARCWSDLAGRIAPDLLARRLDEADAIADLADGWAGCCRCAVAGAETACWDLLAQSRHESIAETIGASPDRADLGIDAGLAVGLYPTIVDLLHAVEPHLVEGYKRVKVRIAPGRDLAYIRALRQHLGDLPLMVDARGAYGRDDLETFRRLDDFELLMFEQPLPADDLDGLAALQDAVATPICLDETVASPAHAAEAIARGAGRIVNLKLQRLGGYGPALAVHALCREHGLDCWVGSTPELGVGQAHGLHLAALANCKYPTDVGPSTRWFVDDYISPPIELTAPGTLAVPTRPGLGYQVDPAKLRRYGVRHEEFAAGS